MTQSSSINDSRTQRQLCGLLASKFRLGGLLSFFCPQSDADLCRSGCIGTHPGRGDIAARGISLPSYPTLTDVDQRRVVMFYQHGSGTPSPHPRARAPARTCETVMRDRVMLHH